MASSSSDESCKAPENFRISSTSNDDDACDNDINSRAKTATGNFKQSTDHFPSQLDDKSCSTSYKCPLCRKQQCRYLCSACVRNGNFSHSTKHNGETLSEQQQAFLNVKSGLTAFSNRYDNIIKERKSSENIRYEISKKKEQLRLLQQLITEKRANLDKLASQRDELHKANAEKRKTLPKYPKKVKELEDYVLDRIEKIDNLRDKHQDLLGQLKYCSRTNIHNLINYIFPISEVVLKNEQKAALGEAVAGGNADTQTIAALADAKNTSYIRGKWVFHESGISEMQYRIVAPSLPANGDYAAYSDWLSDNKDDVPKTTASEITPSRIAAFRIIGALTYTTQLVQLLSYYLDVRLPYKLAYGEFCKKLNEEQFLRKVSKLNSNIMYLAYAQNVKLRALNKNHTLENILVILDAERSDLGRFGCHEVGNAPLAKSIDSLLLGIETATESESEEENSIRLDWEALPSMPAQTDIQTTITNDLQQQQQLLTQQQQQQSTIAEGLITSAANRITSMFRWMK